jgi:uncharacterized protein with PIN domain
VATIKAEDIIDTIFNIRDYPEDYDIEELLEYIDDLVNAIKNNENLDKELHIEANSRKLDMGYCPKCNVKLEIREIKEPHYELSEFGHTPYETLYVRGCPECEEEY